MLRMIRIILLSPGDVLRPRIVAASCVAAFRIVHATGTVQRRGDVAALWIFVVFLISDWCSLVFEPMATLWSTLMARFLHLDLFGDLFREFGTGILSQ